MSWLLINPTNHFLKMFPLGLAYISSSLKKAGFDVKTLNLEYVPTDQFRSAIEEKLRDRSVSVVGLGGLYPEFKHIRNLIAIVKETRPDVQVVVGNGVITCDPKRMLPVLGADVGVIGEGEETVVELAHALESGLPLDAVNGIVMFDRDGTIHQTAPRANIKDIDTIPLPDYEGFNIQQVLDAQDPVNFYAYSYTDNPRMFPILASRSCPFKCTFCYHSINTYRKRSVKLFFDEVEHVVNQYDVNSLMIYDDLFAVKASRLEEFCGYMEKYNLQWQTAMHTSSIAENRINGPLLRRMREAGCVGLGLGLESVNEEVLLSMVKKTSGDQVKEAIRLVNDADITIQGNFIFGDTVETPETANDTLNWWVQNQRYTIQVDPIWVFPGTPLFRQALADGRLGEFEDYLELPTPAINVSKLDDQSYDKMVDTLDIMQTCLNRHPGVVSAFDPRQTKSGVAAYDFTVRCPHCGEDQTYKNTSCFRRLFCRTCGGLYELPLTRLEGWGRTTEEARSHNTAAVLAYTQGDFATAYEEARKATFSNPMDKDALFILGTLALRANFISSAHSYLNKAMHVLSDEGHIYNNFGVALFGEGRIELALLCFRHAVKLDGHFPEADHNIAVTLEALGGDDQNLELVYIVSERSQRDISDLKLSDPPADMSGSQVVANAPMKPRYAEIAAAKEAAVFQAEPATEAPIPAA